MRILITTGFLGFLAAVLAQHSHAFQAEFGLSPDNSQTLLISTIRSARHELLLNAYEFESTEIADAVIDRIQNDVSVQVLVEGHPVTSISSAEKAILSKVRAAMRARSRDSHVYLKQNRNRYVFNHAKYLVVDGETALVTSDNFGSTGHPTPGQIGNRGWETALHDRATAQALRDVFNTDTNPKYGDVEDTTFQTDPDMAPVPVEISKVRPVPAIPIASGDVQRASLFFSPKSIDGLAGIIRSAHRTLEIEYMDLPSVWKEKTEYQSPIVTEILAAAKRGVQIRVLLNDARVFGGKPKTQPNEVTAALMRNYARCNHLQIDARIVDVKGAGIIIIHNKGMIADGERVLVSSINGSRNSVENNREVAVTVESSDAGTYFRNAFDFDWSVSPSLETKDPGVANCAFGISSEPESWMAPGSLVAAFGI